MAKEVRIFSGPDARSYTEGIKIKALKEVNEWSDKEIISEKAIKKLTDDFLKKHIIPEISLKFDETKQKVVSQTWRGQRTSGVADVFQFYIPFEGQIEKIQLRPNSGQYDVETGYYDDKHLRVDILGEGVTDEQVMFKFNKFRKMAEGVLNDVNTTFKEFNNRLKQDMDTIVKLRSKEILRKKARGTSTGFPELD